MEFIEKRRCVIVAAGRIETEDIIKSHIFYDDYVIAADAGYTILKKAGITPDLIVGDFDSSDTPENDIETIVLNPIKDCTDTEFAVKKAVEKGFKDVLILGALGGRSDHSFANITLVAEYKNNDINITLITENQIIYALKDETKSIAKADIYVSLFAFGSVCNVTLEGMFYPLNNYSLSPYSAIGVSNEIVNDSAKITVNGGVLLVMEVNKNTV